MHSFGDSLEAGSATSGSLVCVGVGMTLGSHLTPLARSYIEEADVVFTGLSDGIMELWLSRMNPNVRSLQQYYQEGKSRRKTYREMVDAMLLEVRSGRKVCCAFYGHPGIFALPSHRAIQIARQEGYPAHMEPGVSAADCLFADLGIDPGRYGCQHYEASQVMFYRRRIDTSAYLVLWQAGVAGDQSLARFSTGPAYRQVLVDVLARDYSLDHRVTLYVAATLPMCRPRIEQLALHQLSHARVDMHSTLVIPPARSLQSDGDIRQRLASIDISMGEAATAPAAAAARFDVADWAFATPRLQIRPLSSADETLYGDLFSDAQTMKYIGPPLSRERATRRFAKYFDLPRHRRARRWLLAIDEKSTGCPIGICSIQGLDEPLEQVETGMMLRSSACSRGFATEALPALLARTFALLPVEEIWAQVAADHAVVERLFTSVGFVRREAADFADKHSGEKYSRKYYWSVRRSSWLPAAACISRSV